MPTRQLLRFAAALICCLVSVSAYAQEPTAAAPAQAPANLAYVEGAVEVVQDGVAEPADPPVMLVEGDIVRTRSGRAEIIFGDGTLLHLANDTEVEILDAEHLRLVSGRTLVRMSHAAARPYVVDTPASSVRLEAQGEYGLIVDRARGLEVAVARGTATIHDASPWTIRGGQMLTLAAAGGRPLIQPFNSARFDAFTQWAYERANGFTSSASAAQLPYELRPYGPVFDTYGHWDHVAPYGRVWFPSVAGSWRPYYDGAWSYTRYGWTWHGRDRWSWPTHHFGRWGFTGSLWYWIPANVWAPAWVSWNLASGYVSWAPLGWDNRPAIGFRSRSDYPAYWPDYTPWRAWTVVPRHRFVPRANVRAYAIDGDRLDDTTRLALSRAVPLLPSGNVAVTRGTGAFPGTRPGSVRRPQRVYPSNAGPNDDSPHRAPSTGVERSTGITGPRSRRPGDDPASAPRTWNSGDDRPGRVRDPYAPRPSGDPYAPPSSGDRYTPSSSGEAPRGGARAVPRSGPDSDPSDAPRTNPRRVAPPRAAAPQSNGSGDRGGNSGARSGARDGSERAGGNRRAAPQTRPQTPGPRPQPPGPRSPRAEP